MPDVWGEGEVWGEETMGDDATVGAASPRALRALAKSVRFPPAPAWRRQMAPGVPMPGEGLEPLPLTPDRANGIFAVATQFIQFNARPQAPFQPERLLVQVARDAALAPAGDLFLGQGIFIGRQLATLEFANFNIEFFGPTAFGVRLKLPPAQPGVLISIPVIPNAAITAGTAAVTMMFLGHSLRG